MNCPFCNKDIIAVNFTFKECLEEDHTFFGANDDYSWYLIDYDKKIQVGKSISHQYYFAYLNDQFSIDKIYSIKHLLIKDAVKMINKIFKNKVFI